MWKVALAAAAGLAMQIPLIGIPTAEEKKESPTKTVAVCWGQLGTDDEYCHNRFPNDNDRFLNCMNVSLDNFFQCCNATSDPKGCANPARRASFRRDRVVPPAGGMTVGPGGSAPTVQPAN